MSPFEQITRMINRDYKTDSIWNGKDIPKTDRDITICWNFCQEIYRLYNKELSDIPHDNLKRIKNTELTIPCIVLFKNGSLWHSGVVWPDGLHFLHANFEPPFIYRKNGRSHYVVRQERLTAWPWNNIFEGFYVNVSE